MNLHNKYYEKRRTLKHIRLDYYIFFFSSRRRHTRSCLVSWARRCVYETVVREVFSQDHPRNVRLDSDNRRAVFIRYPDGLRRLLWVDPELGWLVAAVEAHRTETVGYSHARIQPKANRPSGSPGDKASELAQAVKVDMDGVLQQNVEVSFGHVCARVADMFGRPSAVKRTLDLAR